MLAYGSLRTGRRTSARLLGWSAIAVALALPLGAAADGLYLHSIPTAVVGSGVGAAGETLRVRAFVSDPQALAASLAGRVAAVGPDHVEVELGAYPQLEPRGPDGFADASFLIDFDEPPVRALWSALADRHPRAPTLEELRHHTGEAIPRKTMERGWDLASRVAREGVGDCTEHAVLLTALARASGRPARVALGLLIARAGGEIHSVGHAWTEVYRDQGWAPVDATPVAEQVEVLAYLPLVALADEGPGYMIGIARQLQRAWVRRVELDSAVSR